MVVPGVAAGGGGRPAEGPARAQLDQRRHVELAADDVGHHWRLERQVERGGGGRPPGDAGADQHVEPAAVAVVGRDHAMPALGLLDLHLGAAAHLPARAVAAAEAQPGGVAVAGLVAVAALVDDLLGEGEPGHGERAERSGQLDREHRIDRAGAELDVLVRHVHGPERERIGLGRAERHGQAGGHGQPAAQHRRGVAGQQHRVAQPGHGLVAVVDAGRDQLDLGSGQVEIPDRGGDPLERHDHAGRPAAGQADVDRQPPFTDGESLVVYQVDLAAADRRLVIVVLGGDVGHQPAQPGHHLARPQAVVADLPDGKVGVASTRSSAAGAGPARIAGQGQGRDEDDPDPHAPHRSSQRRRCRGHGRTTPPPTTSPFHLARSACW